MRFALAIVTIAFAFCSMTYELLLSQILSSFLGNTLLRYSVTIGLYLFSLGVGALLAERMKNSSPIRQLLRYEILLVLLGGLSVIILHKVHLLGSDILISVVAHALTIAIGLLSGLEIPLIIRVLHQWLALDAEVSEQQTLGLSYVGAFIATVTFAFFFFPVAGLLATAFCVALCNSLASVLLASHPRARQGTKTLICTHIALCVLFGFLLSQESKYQDIFVEEYLAAGTHP